MTMKKCKLCKRLDEEMLIKGVRCSTHKCSLKRPSTSRKRRRPLSEYGTQLKEKQKMKIIYSLREKQFKNYVLNALNKKDKDASEYLMELLERRLDNTVYRLGLAVSRPSARQLVSHGHILINGKKINTPSYRVSPNDKISVKETSKNSKFFDDLKITVKKYNPPNWLKIDKEKFEGEVLRYPMADENEFKINTTTIIEFYSR